MGKCKVWHRTHYSSLYISQDFGLHTNSEAEIQIVPFSPDATEIRSEQNELVNQISFIGTFKFRKKSDSEIQLMDK